MHLLHMSLEICCGEELLANIALFLRPMNKLDVMCQTLGFAEAFSTLCALVLHLTILSRILINRFIIVLLITVDIIASSRLQDLIVESILTIALAFLNVRRVNFIW